MPGRIPENFIRSLLDRADIVEYIGADVKLQKKGKDHWACCPFHQEKTPSFKVAPDRQNYYCFGCKASGNLLGFIMARDNADFVQAIETLAAHYGIEVPREAGAAEHRDEGLYDILSEAEGCFKRWLSDPDSGTAPSEYLKRRGYQPDFVQRFNIGFAPAGWDNLLKKLGSSEERRDQLQKAGLVRRSDSGKTYDMFRDRLMFPIRDARGRVIGFGGRAMGDDPAKYINSPETPVFKKAREVYGLHEVRQAQRRIDELLLVEGYTDVLALHQAGLTNAVATLGTAVNEQHFVSLFRRTNEVICCFDGDTAGRSAARAAMLQALPALRAGKKLRFAFLPEGEDPDSLVSAHGVESLKQRLSSARVLSDYFFEEMQSGLDLATMEDRARLSRLARPEIEKVPDGSLRDLMLTSLAQRTGAQFSKAVATRPEPSAPMRAKSASRRGRESILRERLLSILACYPTLFTSLEQDGQAEIILGGSDGLSALAAYLQKNTKADVAMIHGFFLGTENEAAIRDASSSRFDLGAEQLSAELAEGVRRLAEFRTRQSQREEMHKQLHAS